MKQHQPSRITQLGRGAVVSVLATLLAAHSHSGADGYTPSLFAIVVCAAVAWPVCVVFTGKRRPLLATVIAVAATQGLFHWVFSAVNPLPAQSTPHHGADWHGVIINAGAPAEVGADPLAHALDQAHFAPHTAMLAAHAFAAIVTIILLRYVDAALDALSNAVAFLAAMLLPPRLTVASPASAPRLISGIITSFKKPQLISLPALRAPPCCFA